MRFYSHLIQIDELVAELDKVELSDSEKVYLARLIDSNLHHAILDEVLSNLSEQDKIIFMEHLSRGDHDKIWQLLNSKASGIEEKIKKAAEEIKAELKKDIAEAKKR